MPIVKLPGGFIRDETFVMLDARYTLQARKPLPKDPPVFFSGDTKNTEPVTGFNRVYTDDYGGHHVIKSGHLENACSFRIKRIMLDIFSVGELAADICPAFVAGMITKLIVGEKTYLKSSNQYMNKLKESGVAGFPGLLGFRMMNHVFSRKHVIDLHPLQGFKGESEFDFPLNDASFKRKWECQPDGSGILLIMRLRGILRRPIA